MVLVEASCRMPGRTRHAVIKSAEASAFLGSRQDVSTKSCWPLGQYSKIMVPPYQSLRVVLGMVSVGAAREGTGWYGEGCGTVGARVRYDRGEGTGR